MIDLSTAKLIGVFGTAIGLALGGVFIGYKLNSTKVSELKYTYAVKALKQQALVADHVKNLQTEANKVEKQSHETKKKHEQELVYYSNLVKSLGGLHDSGSPASNNNSLAGSTNQPTGTTSGTELSAGATEFLLNQANRADQVVDQYLSCQRYLNALVEQSKKGAQND